MSHKKAHYFTSPVETKDKFGKSGKLLDGIAGLV